MAKKVVTTVTLTDDIDGSPATQSVSFALDGVSYEIDLNDAHAAELRSSFAEYIGFANKTGGRAKRGSGATAGNGDAARIRAWAKANGHAVPERGRIPAPIREAYAAAN